MSTQKVALIIMDGWGKETDTFRSAIAMADTPNVDGFYKKYTNSELITFGEEVGLPNGQMGNSEVGHMNLGAGRIVYQELMRVNNSIKDNSLKNNPVFQNTLHYTKTQNKSLHIMGLVSDGGVHSHINHIEAVCHYAHEAGIENIYLHAFMDGRDCDPKSGLGFIEQLEKSFDKTNIKIASVIGRYYAMDRDKRWERVKNAYDLMVHGIGEKFKSPSIAVETSYNTGITDEFILPKVMVNENNEPLTTLQDGDAVIVVNFRTDRCREITQVLTQQDMPDFEMKKLALHYVTMTRYDESFENVNVIFEKDNLSNTLGEVLEKYGKTQLRVAETEKYPHVTFFFSGGREEPFTGESRIMINSPKVATYDLMPEMSARQVKDAAINAINEHAPDFICLNFANTDMVGHTGIFEAGMKAAEVVDTCVKELVDVALLKGYEVLLTADHGNADIMINEDGTPNTAHTKNMVPLFYISNKSTTHIKNGKLADIAPTVLHLMGIEIPDEMNGEILIHA
jgi:2,3-bisphosphoglycerate-independent phosphoglycerate mutase